MAFTLVKDFEDTAQTTTSTSYVDVSNETAALSSGVTYLVMYQCSAGPSGWNNVIYTQMLHGSTTIGECAGEGAQVSDTWGSHTNIGATILDGDGTSTLKFQMKVSGGTGYFGAGSIVAMDIDSLVEDTDYYKVVSDSSTLHVTDAATGSWTTAQTMTRTPAAGDHLVIMSIEGHPDTTGTACRVQFTIGGTVVGDNNNGYTNEHVDDEDWQSYCYRGVHNLSASSTDFDIDVRSITNANADFRRGRIIVIDLAVFDQAVQSKDTSGLSTASTTYVDAQTATAFVPNQTEDVLILGWAPVSTSADNKQVVTQLVDGSSTARNVDSGYNTDVGGGAATDDHLTAAFMYVENISSSTTYKTQVKYAGGGAQTAKYGFDYDNSTSAESNIIVISMTEGSSTQTITAGLISNTPTLYSPQLDQNLAMSAIAAGTTLYSPQLDQNLAMSAISAGTTLYSPQLDQNVVAPAIASTTTLYSPQLDQNIAPAAITNTPTMYAPTIDNAKTIGPELIAATTQVYAPTLTGGEDTGTIGVRLGVRLGQRI